MPLPHYLPQPGRFCRVAFGQRTKKMAVSGGRSTRSKGAAPPCRSRPSPAWAQPHLRRSCCPVTFRSSTHCSLTFVLLRESCILRIKVETLGISGSGTLATLSRQVPVDSRPS